ncbi:MAG: phage head completion protein [Paracoccaceae bacterium]
MRRPWRMVLERRAPAPDGMGGTTGGFAPVGVVWGAMSRRGAGPAGTAAGPISRIRWRVTLPQAAPGSPRRPGPGDRLRIGTRVLTVEAAVDRDPRHLDLACFEETRG